MNSQDRDPDEHILAGSFAPRRGVSLLYPISDFPGSANAGKMHLLYSRVLELQPKGWVSRLPAARGRGLKLFNAFLIDKRATVARRARAWIETPDTWQCHRRSAGRPPRAGVD